MSTFSLPRQTIPAVVSESERQLFNFKDGLPNINGALWEIQSGVVRSWTWTSDGTIVTLGFWGAGDLVGQVHPGREPYCLACHSPVYARRRNVHDPNLQEALIQRIWKQEEMLRIIHQPSVADRLLHLLEWLAYNHGQPTPDGMRLNLSLTHQILADTIRASRVTVTRLMSRLEQTEKIQRFRNRSSPDDLSGKVAYSQGYVIHLSNSYNSSGDPLRLKVH
jgi:hypothetical protein